MSVLRKFSMMKSRCDGICIACRIFVLKSPEILALSIDVDRCSPDILGFIPVNAFGARSIISTLSPVIALLRSRGDSQISTSIVEPTSRPDMIRSDLPPIQTEQNAVHCNQLSWMAQISDSAEISDIWAALGAPVPLRKPCSVFAINKREESLSEGNIGYRWTDWINSLTDRIGMHGVPLMDFAAMAFQGLSPTCCEDTR